MQNFGGEEGGGVFLKGGY